MDYLFFDIECCDGRHICSFGYVICDENFNVVEKKDILMNPDEEFDLGAENSKRRIDLAYSDYFFIKQPKFNFFYETIKNLLLKENRVILGHSIFDDIQFIKIACRKFSLPFFEFEVFDTQSLYANLHKDKGKIALEKILEDLDIKINGLIPHKSDDDAYMSLLVAKKICENLNITLKQLLNKFFENARINSLTETKKEKKARILKEKMKKSIDF